MPQGNIAYILAPGGRWFAPSQTQNGPRPLSCAIWSSAADTVFLKINTARVKLQFPSQIFKWQSPTAGSGNHTGIFIFGKRYSRWPPYLKLMRQDRRLAECIALGRSEDCLSSFGLSDEHNWRRLTPSPAKADYLAYNIIKSAWTGYILAWNSTDTMIRRSRFTNFYANNSFQEVYPPLKNTLAIYPSQILALGSATEDAYSTGNYHYSCGSAAGTDINAFP